jgi:hypothetical protein
MKTIGIASQLFVVLALALSAGCGGSARPDPPTPQTPAPLGPGNLNLIFVVSEDLAYQAPGDINSRTANLTNRGLQRSLRMATFLKQQVLGAENVTSIYALEPMTHLQTANNYPDMAGIETVQQFAMLNQIALSYPPYPSYTGNNYPINASYASGVLPSDVAPPPQQFCLTCQGLDFNDQDGDNEALVTRILKPFVPGFYVFSAPWETTRALLANINQLQGYNLAVPASYRGPNYIYAISIAPSGSATMVAYNSNLDPPFTYPDLPAGKIVSTACTAQPPFSITVTGGQGGAVVPAGINTNETVYFIRHAEAHPRSYWSDNNYVGAGQWRALDLPNALRGKVSPQRVVSADPGQFGAGSNSSTGDSNYSTIAPAFTAEPYAIANGLPYTLAAGVQLSDSNADQQTSDFLFTGGTFSNQKVLVAWVFQQIAPTVNKLLASYHGDGPTAPDWPDKDYDSIWLVHLDANGNLSVSKTMCEGINSEALPPTAPLF